MNNRSFVFYTDSDDEDCLYIPFQSDSDNDDNILFLPSILINEDEEIRTWILDLFYEIIYKI